MDGLRREGELDSLGLETPQELQIDGLLNVHLVLVGRQQDVVHRLQDQCGVAKLLEVRSIEARMVLGLYDLFDHAGDFLDFRRRRVIGHADRKSGASFHQAPVILDGNASI